MELHPLEEVPGAHRWRIAPMEVAFFETPHEPPDRSTVGRLQVDRPTRLQEQVVEVCVA